MGRRSDHTRQELEHLFVVEGHKHMAEVGFARFSAREVAKRIGYSVGTLYNVFGTLDRLLITINTRSAWNYGVLDGFAGAVACHHHRIGCVIAGFIGGEINGGGRKLALDFCRIGERPEEAGEIAGGTGRCGLSRIRSRSRYAQGADGDHQSRRQS